jgi:hypothetical protein
LVKYDVHMPAGCQHYAAAAVCVLRLLSRAGA